MTRKFVKRSKFISPCLFSRKTRLTFFVSTTDRGFSYLKLFH